MKTLSFLFVVVSGFFAGACAPTHHHVIVGANGRGYLRTSCRAETPGKCMKRATEVCGQYVIVQPIHQVYAEEPRLEMDVECQVPIGPPGQVGSLPPPPAPPSGPPVIPPPQ